MEQDNPNIPIDIEYDYDKSLNLKAKEKLLIEPFERATQSVINGDENPLDVFSIINDHVKAVIDLKDKIKDLAIEEAEKYGKNFTHRQWNVQLKQGATRWDFNDVPEVSEAGDNYKNLKEIYKRKGILAEANAITIHDVSGKKCFETEDGELKPLPKKIYSSDQIVITKNKQ